MWLHEDVFEDNVACYKNSISDGLIVISIVSVFGVLILIVFGFDTEPYGVLFFACITLMLVIHFFYFLFVDVSLVIDFNKQEVIHCRKTLFNNKEIRYPLKGVISPYQISTDSGKFDYGLIIDICSDKFFVRTPPNISSQDYANKLNGLANGDFLNKGFNTIL